ncbi:MAG: S1C family serine protease [Anaerolineales bacterium]
MRTTKKMLALLALLLLGLTLACSGITLPSSDDDETVAPIVETEPPQNVATVEPSVVEKPVVVASEAEALQVTLTNLYRSTNPSVVYILTPGGSGSGFVYDETGHILTNNHVVENSGEVEVVFSSGDRRRADVVGTDLDSDLAVLQIEDLPPGVAPLPLADGENLEVGQLTIAIGSPFGEQGSMSFGIVSGLGRSLPSLRVRTGGSSYSLPEVIQTDTPINPGNSGGPLLNLQGEVIGINAAIATQSIANSGVGFAIPVNVVERVVPRLIAEGAMVYPYIGATFDSEITLEEQELYDVTQTRGAYVISVLPDSPAAEAGLVGADPQTGQGGDLIIELDGRPVGNFNDLNTYLVLEAEVGQTIEVTVLRAGEIVKFPLTLGARP